MKWSVFFFQAEDGIRDKLVTGVQTCALPISQQTKKQRNSENHDHDGDKAPHGSGERDVAEARSRQCRHCEVEGIDVVADLWIGPVLRLINYTRHYEQKDDEVRQREGEVLIAT